MDDDFDLKELANAPVDGVPWYFRLGQYLSKRKIRGGDRLLAEARRRGMLDHLVVYDIGDVKLRVPLWRPCNQWLEDDVRQYERAFIRILGETICQMRAPVTFIDCGADIGTVSAHAVARCKNIQRVVAFEPNPAAYWVLAENLRAMHMQTEAHNAAVGDFNGHGRLVRAAQDPSAHAMYIAPSNDGGIRVVRIDDLDVSGAVVIKIDVEGTEASVVAGARETIRDAAEVVVAFEAHPRVTERRGRDPIEVMQALLSLRADLTFVVDTLPARDLDPHRRIFDQLPPTRVYNVIAHSAV